MRIMQLREDERDICSCPGLNLFKWPQPANPNSTTPFEIQFSFNGLIESAAEMCQNFFEMKIKSDPSFSPQFSGTY